MPPAPVGTSGTPVYSAASVVTPTTLTPDTGSGYVAGDVILCFTASRMLPPTVATPSGWTRICDATAPATFHLALFAKVAASTSEPAPSVVWSNLTEGASGDPVGAICQAFRGLDTTNLAALAEVVGTVKNNINSTTSSAGGNPITTTLDNDLILKLSVRSQATANTWSAIGFTNITGGTGSGASLNTTSGSDMAAQWAYAVQSPPGLVGSADFSISGGTIISGSSAGVYVALKAATVPTTPVNTVVPVITGTRVVGEQITSGTGAWTGTPTSYAYDWHRNGSSIGASNTSTYTLVTADIGTVITCAVTATNASGNSQPAISNGLTVLAELAASDVQLWTSTSSGLGGAPNVVVPSSTAVFDSVTHTEATQGDVEYRLVYVKNTHLVRSLTGVVAWISSQTTSPTTSIDIGSAVEPAGTDVTAIQDEQTSPISVSFSAPSSEGAGIALGTLGPGQSRGVWLRRTVLAGTSALPSDACTINWSGTPS